ncbi:MAG: hypothetical protein AAF086_04790 [Planctomycetota bacterium]
MIPLFATADNRFVDALVVLVSLVVLILIALAVLLALGLLISRRRPAQVAAPDPSTASSLASSDPIHDPALVAVLTAAAVATLGQPVRVTAIQPVDASTFTLPTQATP